MNIWTMLFIDAPVLVFLGWLLWLTDEHHPQRLIEFRKKHGFRNTER